MMKSVEKRGKTVEEALQLALDQLGVDREQCTITVLEEPKAGWLGLIGGREARIRVEVDQADEAKTEAPSPLFPVESKAVLAERFLTTVIEQMGVVGEVQIRENMDRIYCDISGDDVGTLIGRHGQTLSALQYLANLATGRHPEDRRRLTVDIEGYRQRREQKLRSLVARMAQEVVRTGDSVELEPMDAHERKVVHMALQNYPGITTYSEGADPYRKVVISAESE